MFLFVFANQDTERLFYEYSKLEGIVWTYCDYQMPSIASTLLYDLVLEKIEVVVYKLKKILHQKCQKSISNSDIVKALWHAMDGPPEAIHDLVQFEKY
jgi:hypothetical protein